MADSTHIEWTDATWNPVTGCSVVSPGCTHCYAMKLAGTRLKHHPSRADLTIETKAGPVWNGTVRLNEEWIDQPMRWRKPRRIFVCAHGDLFHEDVPDAWIDRVFAVMALSPFHTFQVLTKRSARMRAYMQDPETAGRVGAVQRIEHGDNCAYTNVALDAIWPLTNVWLGVSAEDQRRADERIPDLLATPAAVRFLSAEPLLGPIDLTALAVRPGRRLDALQRYIATDVGTGYWEYRATTVPGLDWVIVGGENGPRPMHPAWARFLRDQCATAGVPFFFKQWGSWAPISDMTEAQTAACYRSNRRARTGEDQAAVDDVYGRTCVVKTMVMHADGSQHDPLAPGAFVGGVGAMTMFQTGKNAAGRMLTGIEHNGVPERRA